MSSHLDSPPVTPSRVWLVLRLGWTLAEVYGRLTQPNLRWANLFPRPPKKPTGRLYLSTREPTTGEAIWTDMQSLIYLVQQLYPPPKDTTDAAQQQFSDARRYPESIDTLLKSAQQVMLTDEGEFSIPGTFYNDLNHWSRQILAILNAEDPLLAEAATLGAGLADTFWQWRLQRHNPDQEQTWQRLLSRLRMRIMIKRIRQVETYLPSHVGPTLRHSIWEWGKAANDGALLRFAPSLSSDEKENLRGINKRQGKTKKHLEELAKLTSASSEEEKALATLKEENAKIDKIKEKLKAEEMLKNNFEQQLRVWEDLIFNRPIVYRLRAADWWWSIRIPSLTCYSLIIVLIILVPALIIYGLTTLANNLLSILDPLLNWLGGVTKFDDQLKLATAVITVLLFVVAQFRRIANWIRQLYPSIYNWFFISKLKQRTFYAWDGQTKPLWKIWWRQLWFGDN